MFRIRRIYDDTLPIDRSAIEQVQEILAERFPALDPEEVRAMPEGLRDPIRKRYRTILFVAEGEKSRVRGFCLLLHFPDLHFTWLDFISAVPGGAGGGVGGAIYQRVREESLALGAFGLFFESLPDDPGLCPDPDLLKENTARLRFYERFGARPVIGTAYETPLSPEDDCPPLLVYDDLDRERSLPRARARTAVKAILERKYGHKCPPEYVKLVVGSFRDDPVRLREPRTSRRPVSRPPGSVSPERAIAITVNDRHDIHHVHERGYVEAPVRIAGILSHLDRTGLFTHVPVRHFPERHIRAVHAQDFVDYVKRVCARIKPGDAVYPYVFPVRNAARPPRELPVRAGYYCLDTFTPLSPEACKAALRAVDCGLTAAEEILRGRRLAYALVRPPGHHAESRLFGGFCYFNTAAVAAHFLSAHGRVAVLDIDYHHGNGTQEIFYRRDDVLTLSIHGHPRFAYPYFSGFSDERGEGPGEGHNINFPLLERVDGAMHLNTLKKALAAIRDYRPVFLVVGLGLDTAKGDPTGTWTLTGKDFHANAKAIGSLRLPTLVVQEGGYRVRNLGLNARHFFAGLFAGYSAG